MPLATTPEWNWHQTGFRLLRGDRGKDQSYVLFTLGQPELSRLLFPLGDMRKDKVRALAREAGLGVADKPDSQEICFIPSDDYREFLRERLVPRAGLFVSTDGKVLGQHEGIQFFTVGQRRKLGLAGNSGRPMYVISIDAESGHVVLGGQDELYGAEMWASRVNWVSGNPPPDPIEVAARIRYKAKEATATVTAHDGWAMVRFSEPQRAATPGQPVVFYRGDEVLGGGYIEVGTPPARNRKAALLAGAVAGAGAD